VAEDQLIEDYEMEEALEVLKEEAKESEVFLEDSEEVRDCLWLLDRF